MKTINKRSSSSMQIPIYEEFLDKYHNYEDTIIVNQLLYTARSLSIFDIKNLSMYDKTSRTLRKRLTSLASKGVITRKQHPTLYNKSFYTVNENHVLPTDKKLVTLIEASDMIYGDYHIAALINYFRGLISSEKDSIIISISEIITRLQMNVSITSIRKRMEIIEKSGIFTRKLVGRVYEYELNRDLLLKRYTPELISYEANKLTSILSLYLESIGRTVSKGLKASFARMLDNGYDFVSIKHIIAYLGIGKSKYSNRIFTAKNIRDHYEELSYESSKSLSKRKANRYLYKLLNGLVNVVSKIATVPIVDIVNISSEHLLWFEIEKLVNSRINQIRALYNKYSYNTGLDYEDLISECKLFLYKKSTSLNISPDKIESTTIHGHIRQYCHSFRSDHSDIDIENIELVADYSNSISELDDHNNMMDQILDKFSDIPKKAMGIILDMLGAYGKKLTQREAAKKYKMPLSTFSNYIKPHLDEVKRLSGLDKDYLWSTSPPT